MKMLNMYSVKCLIECLVHSFSVQDFFEKQLQFRLQDGEGS